MEDSSLQQALGDIPTEYHEQIQQTAAQLDESARDAFIQNIADLAEKFRKEKKEADEVLIQMEALIVEAEHTLHSSDRAEKKEEEGAEHSQDITQAESILDTL